MEDIPGPGRAAPEVPGYDVGRLLGRGGTAAVWLVTERPTGREFALKCFDAGADAAGESAGEAAGEAVGAAWEEGSGTAYRETEEVMRREVRILSALDHDHLLRAHAVLRLHEPRSGPEGEGALGLVLDYAPGGSVADLVAGSGRLGAGETVTVLTPIAQALQYLHSHGFTHGDVSPGNVLFTAHGKPLLADLGVARMVADTGAGRMAGTEGFSDPAPVDAVRAGLQPERDIYSLAALGWYCLTGLPPVPGAGRPPLPLLVPGVPPALAAALEAGLDEDRRRRPSAAEFAVAVYRSTAAEPLDLSVTAHASVAPQLLTRRAVPRSARERRARRLRGWLGRCLRRPLAGRASLAGRAGRPAPGADTGSLTGADAFIETDAFAGTAAFAGARSRARLGPATGSSLGGSASVAGATLAPPPGAHARTSTVATPRHAAAGGTGRHAAAGSGQDPHRDRGADSGRVGVPDAVPDAGPIVGPNAWPNVGDKIWPNAWPNIGDHAVQSPGEDIRNETHNQTQREIRPETTPRISRGARHESAPGIRSGTFEAGRRRSRRKLWAGAAVAVALFAGVGTAWLGPGGGIAELFGALTAAPPSEAPPAVPPTATAAPGSGVDAGLDGSDGTDGSSRGGESDGLAAPAAAGIPRELLDRLESADPGEAVRGLAALRSLAFSTGNMRLLEEVNVPASAAADADARIGARLAAAGHVLAGFETTLARVQTIPDGGPARTVVDVSAVSSPYQERDAAGHVVAVAPAGDEIRLRLVLASIDGRWRIAQILAEDPALG